MSTSSRLRALDIDRLGSSPLLSRFADLVARVQGDLEQLSEAQGRTVMDSLSSHYDQTIETIVRVWYILLRSTMPLPCSVRSLCETSPLRQMFTPAMSLLDVLRYERVLVALLLGV